MKYFRMSYEEVVFRRSYINIMLLNRAIPSYKFDKDDDDDMDDEYMRSLKKQKRKKDKQPKPRNASEFFMNFM